MTPNETAAREIEQVLAREIRPALSAHTGSIEVVDVRGADVRLELRRSCGACYFRRSCVANLIEPTLAAHFGDRFRYRVR